MEVAQQCCRLAGSLCISVRSLGSLHKQTRVGKIPLTLLRTLYQNAVSQHTWDVLREDTDIGGRAVHRLCLVLPQPGCGRQLGHTSTPTIKPAMIVTDLPY